ncbi:uncharacterized protein KNAG_0D02040 [Huiozyma naganishii CBS 8797]|uniref:Uncharacterized protein n=1 Tax=Huiozyma naganishii (strain ATCC MYA-139 / BCRC 22969 / CBS 8797 / KCTC 17520 / NBRC 10181 / NCYC 3082 / Yp74L-3) TaxID=1071383 RepID=J7R540_HUIN7|nr:hypothetical protein KNAG_0D02040 [Kazachstania naganishii CBS 8797]CCK69955.1 hypothetical protein KNAG_0D02040 [Kazachstania naganishii CBS 8797]
MRTLHNPLKGGNTRSHCHLGPVNSDIRCLGIVRTVQSWSPPNGSSLPSLDETPLTAVETRPPRREQSCYFAALNGQTDFSCRPPLLNSPPGSIGWLNQDTFKTYRSPGLNPGSFQKQLRQTRHGAKRPKRAHFLSRPKDQDAQSMSGRREQLFPDQISQSIRFHYRSHHSPKNFLKKQHYK